jgi:hypothetical protein
VSGPSVYLAYLKTIIRVLRVNTKINKNVTSKDTKNVYADRISKDTTDSRLGSNWGNNSPKIIQRGKRRWTKELTEMRRELAKKRSESSRIEINCGRGDGC